MLFTQWIWLHQITRHWCTHTMLILITPNSKHLTIWNTGRFGELFFDSPTFFYQNIFPATISYSNMWPNAEICRNIFTNRILPRVKRFYYTVYTMQANNLKIHWTQPNYIYSTYCNVCTVLTATTGYCSSPISIYTSRIALLVLMKDIQCFICFIKINMNL